MELERPDLRRSGSCARLARTHVHAEAPVSRRPRTRPEAVVFICDACGGLLLKLPRRWKNSDAEHALEAARIELPCECEDADESESC